MDNSELVIGTDNFVYVDHVRIARYLPDRRALEFIEPRTGRRRSRSRRRVIVRLEDLNRLE